MRKENLMALLAQEAVGNKTQRFKKLWRTYLLDERFLYDCFQMLKDAAPGVDGVVIKDYDVNLLANIKKLANNLSTWSYRPTNVKRVWIPKKGGKLRPLGIPTVEDKIVQMACKRVLEAIYEGSFNPISYGFRPKRSCHMALHQVSWDLNRENVSTVVDMDIEKCFDSIDHKMLLKVIEVRVDDKDLIRLLVRMLRTESMDGSKYTPAGTIGTPQGSVLSPLLANIYLHYIIDVWFMKEFKAKQKKYGFCSIVRYADDFVACFEHPAIASLFVNQLKHRLSLSLLKVAKDKCRMVSMGKRVDAQRRNHRGNSFNFLGFTFYNTKTRSGAYTARLKTSEDNMSSKLKAMSTYIKKARSTLPIKEWWKVVVAKVKGHIQYFGVSGNFRQISAYVYWTKEIAFKYANRRSQKRSYNWEQFNRFVEFNPLPTPTIKYNLWENPCAKLNLAS